MCYYINYTSMPILDIRPMYLCVYITLFYMCQKEDGKAGILTRGYAIYFMNYSRYL